jgi:hypothetical protein
MTCVTYSIRLNNVSLESLKPSRGLPHGDPLLSYFVLFVVDALSKLLQKEVQQVSCMSSMFVEERVGFLIFYLQTTPAVLGGNRRASGQNKTSPEQL